MTLTIIATGSRGNCYALEDSEGRKLLLDAGISYKSILRGIGYNTLGIQGICVTHTHMDHYRAVPEMEKLRFNVFKGYESEVIQSMQMGPYTVKSFRVEHDVPCCGYHISHDEMGTLVYFTDTEYCKYRFGAEHFLVECNYDERLLDDEHPALEHVLRGHMELKTTVGFLQNSVSRRTRTVTICHMSDRNLDLLTASQDIQESLPEDVTFHIASPGEKILLQKGE